MGERKRCVIAWLTVYGGGEMSEEERKGKRREFMIISGLYNGKLKGEGENWF
jgi:hypothetical protein